MAYLPITIEVNPDHAGVRWGDGMDKYEFELIAEQHYDIRFDELADERERFYDDWLAMLCYNDRTGRINNFDAFMATVKKQLSEDDE